MNHLITFIYFTTINSTKAYNKFLFSSLSTSFHEINTKRKFRIFSLSANQLKNEWHACSFVFYAERAKIKITYLKYLTSTNKRPSFCFLFCFSLVLVHKNFFLAQSQRPQGSRKTVKKLKQKQRSIVYITYSYLYYSSLFIYTDAY